MNRTDLQAKGERIAEELDATKGLSERELQISMDIIVRAAVNKMMADGRPEKDILAILFAIAKATSYVMNVHEQRRKKEQHDQEKAQQVAKDALDEAQIKADLGET